MSTPLELRFTLTLDATHKTLALEGPGGERIPLVSCALSVLRDSIGARTAWGAICAGAITAAELAALDGEKP